MKPDDTKPMNDEDHGFKPEDFRVVVTIDEPKSLRIDGYGGGEDHMMAYTGKVFPIDECCEMVDDVVPAHRTVASRGHRTPRRAYGSV